MKKIICFDIGGTAVKYGILTTDGVWHGKGIFPTDAKRGAAYLLGKIIDVITDEKQQHNLAGISISTAGIVDTVVGKIIYALPKITGYTGTLIKPNLENAVGLPCEVENDVNCAGLAEQKFGSAKGSPLTVCITVGSGIGGAVLLNGRVITGVSGCAGEIGFLHFGGKSLEEIAAVPALITKVSSLKGMKAEELDGKKIFALAKTGDVAAGQAIDEMVDALGRAIADIACILNPAVIVLGGGIMAQQEYLAPRVNAAVEKYLLQIIYKDLQVKFAHFGNDAGIIGALENFCQKHTI